MVTKARLLSQLATSSQGVAAGSTTVSAVAYNGTTKLSANFDGGTVAPSNTVRLNYDGNLYVTNLTVSTAINVPLLQVSGSISQSTSNAGDFALIQSTSASTENAMRIDSTQTTSGSALKISNSGLNKQFSIRCNSTGGVDFYMGQTAGGSSTSGTVGLSIDSAGAASTGGFNVGYKEVPQNSQSVAYTLVLSDSGKHIYHPSADTTARTWTIPANASVAFPIGTAIMFVNDTSAGVVTIAITTDTLVLSGLGTTGSRTLAANGTATAVKVTATRWIISGSGLT